MTPSVTLTTQDGQQRRAALRSEVASNQAIPCFQCGLCCIKWQPLLNPAEIRQLAGDLGLSVRTFRRRYLRPFPLRRGWGQLKTGDVGCIFLRFEAGRSFCSIYHHRPQVCRDWAAGLDKSECIRGLQRMGEGSLLTLTALYTEGADRSAFVQQVVGPGPAASETAP